MAMMIVCSEKYWESSSESDDDDDEEDQENRNDDDSNHNRNHNHNNNNNIAAKDTQTQPQVHHTQTLEVVPTVSADAVIPAKDLIPQCHLDLCCQDFVDVKKQKFLTYQQIHGILANADPLKQEICVSINKFFATKGVELQHGDKMWAVLRVVINPLKHVQAARVPSDYRKKQTWIHNQFKRNAKRTRSFIDDIKGGGVIVLNDSDAVVNGRNRGIPVWFFGVAEKADAQKKTDLIKAAQEVIKDGIQYKRNEAGRNLKKLSIADQIEHDLEQLDALKDELSAEEFAAKERQLLNKQRLLFCQNRTANKPKKSNSSNCKEDMSDTEDEQEDEIEEEEHGDGDDDDDETEQEGNAEQVATDVDIDEEGGRAEYASDRTIPESPEGVSMMEMVD
mmetsp:Transcript_52114/g.83052  ORF Transcript_52114/g.83052 Transcript_52114/m.83052 type:complete len:392 (+) Transcript_52114:186-1361(+)